MEGTQEIPQDVTAELAEYHVLNAYDTARNVRYGDMARARRAGELRRRADKLFRGGVPADRMGEFPTVTHDELQAAWTRVVESRRRRFEKSVEPYLMADGTTWLGRFTKHAAATREAFAAAARELDVEMGS